MDWLRFFATQAMWVNVLTPRGYLFRVSGNLPKEQCFRCRVGVGLVYFRSTNMIPV